MSKRYGRQQKAKARKRITFLESKVAGLHDALIVKDNATRCAQKIVKLAEKANPCTVFSHPTQSFGGGQVARMVQHPNDTFLPLDNEQKYITKCEYQMINLYELEVALQKEPFNKMMHLRCSYSRDSNPLISRYMISEEGIKYGELNHLVYQIVSSLSDAIARGDK